jgi:hypothetical protein
MNLVTQPNTSYSYSRPPTWLIRLGGICALLAMLSIAGAAIANLIAANAGGPAPNRLLNFYSALLGNTADGWLAVAGSALLIPSAFGFYAAQHAAGRARWTAPAAVLVGLSALLVGYALTLLVTRELQARLPTADAQALPTFIVILTTVRTTADILLVVGSGFTFGLGVGLFGLFSLYTPGIPNGVGALGILVGLLHVGWLDALAPPPLAGWLTAVKLLDLALFLIWMGAMGVTLLRRSRHK